MEYVNGGVTSAKGFLASGAEAGIKYKNRKDMALVVSEVPAVCAGTFTTNVVKAAPVKWDQKIVEESDTVRAVILNSGIANACTGAEGAQLNEWIAVQTAQALSVTPMEVCTASTGVIGMQIPKDPIERGIEQLVRTLDNTSEAARMAAEAIMTTDTTAKECAVSFTINEQVITVGGMSKGSGMIHPNMATMLCVITTDALIEKEVLQCMVSEVVADSFNMISVDRDTSTNDTVLVLANGRAMNPSIKQNSIEYQSMKEALFEVCVTLAKMMAADGEGATKLFETTVKNAKTKAEAVMLAKSVITSNLVKTAVYGQDANWGRILCALGYSGADFDPEIVDLTICSKEGSLLLVENGKATEYSEDIATKILSADEVTAICDMKQGHEDATAWGCDLTYEYVKINGDYRS